jgi:hypothetical protein
MVSPLDLLEFREEAERSRKEFSERSIALEDIKNLGENRVICSLHNIFQSKNKSIFCLRLEMNDHQLLKSYRI